MKELTFSFIIIFFATSIIFAQADYGMATSYSDKFHGSKTASGESYDKNKLVAAHKTFEFGSKVRVTNLDNRKTVIVVINDRGPYPKGEIINLSAKAAAEIGMKSGDKSKVKVEKVTAAELRKPSSLAKKEKKKKRNTSKGLSSKGKVPTSYSNTKINLNNKNFSKYDLYKVNVAKESKAGFGVQVASYASYENALRHMAIIQDAGYTNVLVNVEKGAKGQTLYRIILGAYETRTAADATKKSAKKRGLSGFVIELKGLK